MNIKRSLNNTSLQLAVLAALAASIAAYMILSSGIAAKPAQSTIKNHSKTKRTPIKQREISERVNEEKMLTGLRISDFEILRPRLKKGTRIDIYQGYNNAQDTVSMGQSILENILVVEIPVKSDSKLSGEQGILIEVSGEECKRLISMSSSEPLRIVIKEGSP